MPGGVYDNIYDCDVYSLDDSPVTWHITEVCPVLLPVPVYHCYSLSLCFRLWSGNHFPFSDDLFAAG